jgi:hypothetical protein
MTTYLATWIAAHALLLALALRALDIILLKFHHSSTGRLPFTLAVMLLLSLVLRRAAQRDEGLRPHVVQRVWRALDAPRLAWLVFFVALLLVFHIAFDRAGGDGREYFAQLHSVFIDRDLDLSNEARDFGAAQAAIFPFGSALLWMPFYLVAHLWLAALNGLGGSFARDGYTYPYQMAIGLGTLTYGFVGLLLVYRIACDYFSRWLSLAATVVVCVGSFIFWYMAVESAYVHGNSLFAVTLFIFLWYRTRTARPMAMWGWLGVSGALMTMVRWQNAVFLALPVFDATVSAWRALRQRDGSGLTRTTLNAAMSALGFMVGFLPQMYFWRVVNGGWLAVPHGQAGQMWWDNSLMLDVLFSPNHGLLAWHPILYLSLLGVPLFLKRDRQLGMLLVGLFVAQVYVNGAVTSWTGGSAFGGRRFEACALLFVLGLAALIRWGQDRPRLLWVSMLGVPMLVNVFFMSDVRTARLPMGEALSANRILGATTSWIGNPFSFPGSAIFALRTGLDPGSYDRLGVRQFNNVLIDVGAVGDDDFLGTGWSGRERNEAMTFRWGVARRSTVGIALMGPRLLEPGESFRLADYVLRLRVAPFTFPGSPPQALRIEVNGQPLAELTLRPELSDYKFDVPHDLLRRSLNGITFHYGYARSPKEVASGDDERPLAVLFDYVHLVQTQSAP